MKYGGENMESTVSVKTFVLFDTETTGLPSPGNHPHIIELCFVAVTREELLKKQTSPRVRQKLLLCFNPCKKIGFRSSDITGLHNDALEDMKSFSEQASLITTFLRNLPQPVCLIAHNGNMFDFPLLVSHLSCVNEAVPENILCTDSLEALRTFDGLPPVPEFLLQRRKANSVEAVQSAADRRGGKSLKKIDKVSGNMLKLNGTQRTESRDETNINHHLVGNDSSDNLKRTAQALEISDVNSKQAKCSSPHAVVWDKVEHTPRALKTAKSFDPELINGSEELRKRTSKVKQNLFKEDSRSDIDNNQQDSDQHQVLQVDTQNHCSLGNSSAGPSTSTDLAESSVNNMQTANKWSYSLPKVYARMFGQQPMGCHTAEGDCLALLKILHNKMTEFASWCDRFAVPLMSIKPMY